MKSLNLGLNNLYIIGDYMDFSKEEILNFQIFLGFACFFKVRDILLKSMCDIVTSDIGTIVDNSISNFLGDENGK